MPKRAGLPLACLKRKLPISFKEDSTWNIFLDIGYEKLRSSQLRTLLQIESLFFQEILDSEEVEIWGRVF